MVSGLGGEAPADPAQARSCPLLATENISTILSKAEDKETEMIPDHTKTAYCPDLRYLLTGINMLLALMLMSDILASKAEAFTNNAVATESLAAEDQSPPRPPSPNNNEIPLSIFEVVE